MLDKVLTKTSSCAGLIGHAGAPFCGAGLPGAGAAGLSGVGAMGGAVVGLGTTGVSAYAALAIPMPAPSIRSPEPSATAVFIETATFLSTPYGRFTGVAEIVWSPYLAITLVEPGSQ